MRRCTPSASRALISNKLDDLDLKPGRAFGYWFDFGDDWYHQVQVDRIDQAETLIMSAVFFTTNNGTVPVKFSASDKLKINLGVNTRLQYKLK